MQCSIDFKHDHAGAKALRKKTMMNITLKRTGTLLLLAGALSGATLAFAQPRFLNDSYAFNAQNERHRSNQDRRGNEDRGSSRDRSGDNAGRNAERNEPRRGERLSPDERRTLRRQIDEAGRDIYTPRR
jgi:hypothetical protein